MTPEQFAEIKAWLAWDGRCSAGVKLEAIVEDLVAEVERLQGELAKTQRACQTLGKVVDRQAVDICRISGVPMPESGDADFERAWSVAFEMADELERLRAQGPVLMYTDEYRGFQGCTDRNPDICACATDEDLECEVCGEVIAGGLMMTTLIRLSYPLLPDDHDAQVWETHHAHADCRAALASGDQVRCNPDSHEWLGSDR